MSPSVCKSYWVLYSWDEAPEILDKKPTKKSRPADWYLFEKVGIPTAVLEGYRRAKKEAQSFWGLLSPYVYCIQGSPIRAPKPGPFGPHKCVRTYYFDDRCKEFQYRN